MRYWYAQENLRADFNPDWVLIDKFEVAKYLDSLAGTSPYDQGFTWEGGRSNDTYEGQDSFYVAMGPSNYRLFSYPLGVLARPPDVDSVAAINDKLNSLSETLRLYRNLTEAADVPFFYTAQAFATDSSFNVWDSLAQDSVRIFLADITRPTSQEIKCFGFMGLCYGIDGLWYWLYDEGTNWHGNPRFSGLVDQYDSIRTFKYYAVSDTVAPFVSRYASLIASLDRRAAGLLDTLAGDTGSFITDFESTNDTPYVEAGFFVDQASAADYLVLVNRRTDTASTQILTLTIDPSSLQSFGSTMYYLIDKNLTYAGSTEDTTLAGPVNGSIVYSTTIEPGGAKFIKVVEAPERITGIGFPLKWWGKIEADDSLTLGAGRSMTLTPPLELTMHSKCGAGEVPVPFNIAGQLTAEGTADSFLIFKYVWDGYDSASCPGGLGDSLHWTGFVFSGNAACTLRYCMIWNAEVAVTSDYRPPVLDHVITENTGVNACKVEGDSTTSLEVMYCDFDQGMDISSVPLATITGTRIASSTSSVQVVGSTVQMIGDTILNYASSAAIYVDSTSRATLKQILIFNLFIDHQGIGILFRGKGSLDSCTVTGGDTAIVLDPGPGDTVSLSVCRTALALKGFVARSGVISLDSCFVSVTRYTCIDAFAGSASLRIDSCYVNGPSTAAGVSIGPEARLVARNCKLECGYIGFEIKGDGPDTVTGCRILNNEYYGLWFADGDSADYSHGNYVTGDTTHSPSIGTGYYAYRQSIESTADTVDGYYGCLFKYFGVGSSSATVDGLVAIGASPDGMGIHMQGTSSDTAMVQGSKVNEDFNSMHAFLYGLRVDIEECEFVSTGVPQTSAYYGIYDQGYTSGRVACTKVLDQKYACIGRSNGSTIDYGDANQADPLSGENSIYVTDSAGYANCKYFWNFAYDTVKAEDNWWGASAPPSSRFGGYVDRTPYLTSESDCQQWQGGDAKIAAVGELPLDFVLSQNYPNPFNPSTTISYSLPTEQRVRLELFNVLGQRVRTLDLGLTPAGQHSVFWNGRDEVGHPVGSGLYFYRLLTQEFTATRKMLLLK